MELSDRRRGPASRNELIVGLYAGLGVVAFVIGAIRGDWDLYRVAGVSTTWKLVLSPLVGIALGLGVVFMTRLSVHRFDWARRLHRDFRGLLGHLTARDVFILAVASSLGEELLFRGALQPWIGLVPSAIVFALLHIGPCTRFLPWTFSALVIGLVFGALSTWLGDLGAPIAAHFVINFMNLDYITRVELPAES
jgi:membrane protease YdiL (CAAX protease family)